MQSISSISGISHKADHSALIAPIAEIRGVFMFERRNAGEKFVAYSPPGHLLHLVIEGGVRQSCNGRDYQLQPGDLLWYHGNEFVEGICEQTPWRFYSVVFHAPTLPPPDFACRLTRLEKPERKRAERLFAELFEVWTNSGEIRGRGALKAHAALSQLVLLMPFAAVDSNPIGAPDHWLKSLWWNIENRVRENLGRVYSLGDLAGIGNVSPATVHRASLAAVRCSPVRRVKTLRLEMARGLLGYSRDSIGEIAEKIGYERVNEFSRDFRKEFGTAPSMFRNRAD